MVEKKERPVRAYEILENVGGSNQSAKKRGPSISELIDRQKEMIASRIEILQAHQIEQDLRRGLYTPPDPNQPQQTGAQSTQSLMSSIPPEVAIELSKMPDEERAKMLQVYQQMAMMESMKSGNPNAAMMMMPFMIGWGKSDAGKGADIPQMMQFATSIISTIKELGGAKQGWGPSDLLAILQYADNKKSNQPDTMTAFLMDRNRILEDRLHETSGGGSVWDTIMGDEKVFERLKSLGSGNTATAMSEFGVKAKEIDLKIAQITQDGEDRRFQWKAEFDLKQEQSKQEQKNKDAQLSIEQNRWDSMRNLGDRVFGVLGKAIASGEAEATVQKTQAPPIVRTPQIEAPQIQAPPPTTKPEPVFMECKVEGCDGKILLRDPTRSASVMCSNGHNLDYTV